MKFCLAPVASFAILAASGLSLLSAVEADRAATRSAILASWGAPVDLGPVPQVDVPGRWPTGARVPLGLPERPRFAWDLAEDKPAGEPIACRVEAMATGGKVRFCSSPSFAYSLAGGSL